MKNKSENKRHPNCYLMLPIVTVCLGIFLSSLAVSQPAQFFEGLYEPSGVVQSGDGRIMLVEDEGRYPLFLSPLIAGNGTTLILKPLPCKRFAVDIDDLEGIARGRKNDIFLVTSHSATKKGKRKHVREKLVKLTMAGSEITSIETAGSLLPSIRLHLEHHTSLDEKAIGAINIEGIAFDGSKERLLIGLREPLMDKKAIILQLLNPYQLFEKGGEPRYSDATISLDLQGTGIRSLTCIDKRGLYLVSGEVAEKGGKRISRVWVWDETSGTIPRSLNLPELKGVSNIEGIALVEYRNRSFFLFVSDNGQRSKEQGGTYRFVENLIFPSPRP